MIELLSGENNFELTRALKKRAASFDGEVEHFDGASLTLPGLTDIIGGQTLFAAERLCVITSLSENAALWHALPELLPRAHDATDIILVETKPDKRTTTYKWLKKHAQQTEFANWTMRDAGMAEEWLRSQAKARGTTLTHQLARLIVERIGVEQWQLHHALDKISLLDDVNEATIRAITDVRSDDDVFQLLETALRGDASQLDAMLHNLEQTEEPYRVFGLLNSQIIQLVALVLGRDRDVAGDLSASPYVLSKLSTHATRLSPSQATTLLKLAAATDRRLKSTPAKPWMLIAHMLSSLVRV